MNQNFHAQKMSLFHAKCFTLWTFAVNSLYTVHKLYEIFQSQSKVRYLERLCKKDVDAVAIKIIRMHDISLLKPFYDPSYDLNFRAILLIRDPRSMFHSRKSIALNLNHYKQRVGCPRAVVSIPVQNLDTLKRLQNKWWLHLGMNVRVMQIIFIHSSQTWRYKERRWWYDMKI